MSEQFSSQERLRILRLADHERRWYSVEDKRVCLICERIISGHEIRISGSPDDYQLACPTEGCPGNTSHWFLYRPSPQPPLPAPAPGALGEIDFLSDSERARAGSS